MFPQSGEFELGNWTLNDSTGEYLMKLSLYLDHQTGKVSAI